MMSAGYLGLCLGKTQYLKEEQQIRGMWLNAGFYQAVRVKCKWHYGIFLECNPDAVHNDDYYLVESL